jgi:membrane associated rhomboid family serine protease/Flp pilus assembly protein TadD
MTVQRLPWVTIGIIALNFVVFVFTWPAAKRDYARTQEVQEELMDFVVRNPGVLDESCLDCPGKSEFDEMYARFETVRDEHVFSRLGYVPEYPKPSGLIGALFLHAGWMHLIGNMYLLWLCGCSIEDVWGRPLYAVVYLTGGIGAALAHAFVTENTTAHLVGASGAIAALMGVFLIRCYDTRIRFFYWVFLTVFGTFFAPAWIMLLLWFLREVFYAFVFGDESSVAFMAHIGGFVYGAAVASVVKLTRVEEKLIAPSLERKTNLVLQDPGLQEAIAKIDSGDYTGAIDHLKRAGRMSPNDPDLPRLLAQTYLRVGQPVDAAQAFRRELALHIRRREHELIVDTYREVLSAHPDATMRPNELFAVAGAHAAMGEHGEALSLYERVLALAEEGPQKIRAGLALAKFHFEEGAVTRALEFLDRIEPLAAGSPEWMRLVEERRATYSDRAW